MQLVWCGTYDVVCEVWRGFDSRSAEAEGALPGPAGVRGRKVGEETAERREMP